MGQESTWLHQFRDYDRDLQDLQSRAVEQELAQLSEWRKAALTLNGAYFRLL